MLVEDRTADVEGERVRMSEMLIAVNFLAIF